MKTTVVSLLGSVIFNNVYPVATQHDTKSVVVPIFDLDNYDDRISIFGSSINSSTVHVNKVFGSITKNTVS